MVADKLKVIKAFLGDTPWLLGDQVRVVFSIDLSLMGLQY
jgi:hypothetical protein